MNLQEQQEFIREMYVDIFEHCNHENIPHYFADDFVEENNYDILRSEAFEAHIKALADSPPVRIALEILVNIPGELVVRAIVHETEQIAGGPPASLLLSHWTINNDGLIDYCREVEYAQ